MKPLVVFGIVVCMTLAASRSGAEGAPAPEAPPQAAASARDRGLVWLTEHQSPDGSWGKQYSIAVTSFACLSYLAASDEPFDGPQGKALQRGLAFLMSQQTDGVFGHQGHAWIHGQGFASLALSEAYGRSLRCRIKPDMDMQKVKATVEQAVGVIAENQSHSGGWWYTPDSKGQHEGSTTVTAVQALVSAANFGIDIDQSVLEKGFEYLKKCQNDDGGFDYQLGPGQTSMKEGTAADVATLALMKKFDYAVMMNGYKFLLKVTPGGISGERFPYYGHFYGCMGMKLVGEEFKGFTADTTGYVADVQKDLIAWQQADASWPVKGWVKDQRDVTPAYGTAFAALTLSVPEGRLSIFNRTPPPLPLAERPT